MGNTQNLYETVKDKYLNNMHSLSSDIYEKTYSNYKCLKE